jgi:enoyl-CoA hydratase/carnithine racemase
VADETAIFALPEGQGGIYVVGGASVHVTRLLGAARMADMMLTGRVLDAAEGSVPGWFSIWCRRARRGRRRRKSPHGWPRRRR